MAEVKNRVRELRRAAGLSVEDLEGMTDVSAYIIKSMESGHTGVHADNAYKLAQYFGVSMEYLCGYSDDVLQIRVHHHKPGEKLPDEWEEGTLAVRDSDGDTYIVQKVGSGWTSTYWVLAYDQDYTGGYTVGAHDEFDWMVIPSDRKKADPHA